MQRYLLFLLGGALVAAATPSSAQAQEVLDREFMIGPRLGLAVVVFDTDRGENGQVPAPLVAIGVDLRKELGRVVLRLNGDLQIGTDFDGAGLSTDIGTDFYLTTGDTSLYAGPYLGLRAGTGPYDYNANAIGFGFGAHFGIMFRRTHSTRVFVELTGGHAFMSYGQDSIGTRPPPAYGRTELAVTAGVGF